MKGAMFSGANRSREDRTGFGMGAALAVSIGVHLLLLLAGWLFPPSAHSQPPDLEETVLRFDLTPAEPGDEFIEPLGDVPVPAEQPQPAQPMEAPQEESPPTLDDFVADPAPADLPPPPIEQDEVVPQEEVADLEAIEVAEQVNTGLEIDEDGIESEGEREASRPATQAAPEQNRFNMENALQDFGKAISRPQPDAEGTQQGLSVPDLPAMPATGFGFGNLEFESRDFDWSDYARQIYGIIWRAWHNRLYVTADEFERWGRANRSFALHHFNRVAFTIEKNGHVTGIVLEGASGCYPLDDSSLDALREVILPPLPPDFPRDQETVHARFIADGDVRTMRRFLAQLKRAGYF
jgi:outer membrane biosynthesis protein TonB